MSLKFEKLGILSVALILSLLPSSAFAGPNDDYVRRHDFDADSLGDLYQYDSSKSVFTIRNSSDGRFKHIRLGRGGEVAVPGDYNGDGVAEPAVFDKSSGAWTIAADKDAVTKTTEVFGASQIPVPGTYTYGSCTSIATYDPRKAVWSVKDCETGDVINKSVGQKSLIPVPAPADFDCDGLVDMAVFHKLNSTWEIHLSNSDRVVRQQFGLAGDIPVAGDYDKDSCADVAVYRPTSHTFFSKKLNDGLDKIKVQQWGLRGDWPYTTDVDGDGATDYIVFRPTDSVYYITASSGAFFTAAFPRQDSTQRLFKASPEARISQRSIGFGDLRPDDIDGFMNRFCGLNIRIPDLGRIVANLGNLLGRIRGLVSGVLNFQDKFLGIKADFEACGSVELPDISIDLPDIEGCVGARLPSFNACISDFMPDFNACVGDFVPTSIDACLSASLPDVNACLDIPDFGGTFEGCVEAGVDELLTLNLPSIDIGLLDDVQLALNDLRLVASVSETVGFLRGACEIGVGVNGGGIGIGVGTPPLVPGAPPGTRTRGDFTGDGLANITSISNRATSARTRSVFNKSSNAGGYYQWNVTTDQGITAAVQFGAAGDILVPGDYNGSGVMQPAVVRVEGANALWRILEADGSTSTESWGGSGDDFHTGDITCDGRDDLIYSTDVNGARNWRIKSLADGSTRKILFGRAQDKAFIKDMNGDSCDDIVIAQSDGNLIHWKVFDVKNFKHLPVVQWGLAGDTTLPPSDMNGDGAADINVVRPINGLLHTFIRFSNGLNMVLPFGLTGDIPFTADFSGVNHSELAVYRPSTNQVYIRRYNGGVNVIGLPAGIRELVTPDGQAVALN